MVDLRRMRFLINRMPLARYRVDLAMARATRVSPVLTGMPHVSGVSSMVENGVIELVSMQFDKRAQFHITQVPKEKQNDWADYLRGATWALAKKYEAEAEAAKAQAAQQGM